jgi:hypothetical protein
LKHKQASRFNQAGGDSPTQAWKQESARAGSTREGRFVFLIADHVCLIMI